MVVAPWSCAALWIDRAYVSALRLPACASIRVPRLAVEMRARGEQCETRDFVRTHRLGQRGAGNLERIREVLRHGAEDSLNVDRAFSGKVALVTGGADHLGHRARAARIGVA